MVWIRKDNYATARMDLYVKDQDDDQTATQQLCTFDVSRVEYNVPFKDELTIQAIRR